MLDVVLIQNEHEGDLSHYDRRTVTGIETSWEVFAEGFRRRRLHPLLICSAGSACGELAVSWAI